MRSLFAVLLVVCIAGCKKESNNSRVDVYLLKSFGRTVDTSYYPAVSIVKDPVLETQPLVSNSEITGYVQSTNTFTLSGNIYDRVKDFGPDKAFAVTVNNEIIYCGMVHPAYLSSLRFGIATIDPIITTNELVMRYILLSGASYNFLLQMDKRNDDRLLDALRATGRLR